MAHNATPRVSKAVVLSIAGEAEADPRSVRKVLAGKPVRGMVADRIEASARRRGVLPPPAPDAA